MTLRKCPCCQKVQTTRNAEFKGRVNDLLWFNCKSCDSTFILLTKEGRKRMNGKGTV